nr:helix-turn-helix domain-containing protein [Nocardia asteroides]
MARPIATHNVAYRVRRLRTQRGWSAQKLADHCRGVLTRSTIAKIESGVRQAVTVEELAVLAVALGVDETALLAEPTAAERLGDALVETRRAAKISVPQLADRAHVGTDLITAIERVGRIPAWATVSALVEAMNADVGEFRRLWEAADAPGGKRLGPSLAIVSVAPQQLPPPTRTFVGRTRELGVLDGAFAEQFDHPGASPVICVLSGTGGVGKTSLALAWAHRNRKKFRDGCLYVDLHGFDSHQPASALSAMHTFLFGLGIPDAAIPDDLSSVQSLYRTVVAEKRILVVLDNAQDASQVTPLLPGGELCFTVVTSRQQLSTLVADYGAVNITVGELSVPDSVDLLKKRIGREFDDLESLLLERIARLCTGLPLALNIVGAQAAMNVYPLTELVDRLRAPDNRLDALEGADFNLRSVLGASYETLDDDSARLFRLLGLVPGTAFDRFDASALADTTPDVAGKLLEGLLRSSLIEASTAGKFQMHELLRIYAGDRLEYEESEEVRHSALARFFSYLLSTASDADRHLDSYWEPLGAAEEVSVASRRFFGQRDAADWFASKLDVLLASIRIAAASGFHQFAWQLAAVLTTFMYRQVRWSQWSEILETAAESARILEDAAAEARINRILGTANARLGRFGEARELQERALENYRQLGDRDGQAHTLLMLCRLFNWQGRYRDARRCAAEALEIYTAIDHHGRARAMIDLARSQSNLGEFAKSIVLATDALEQCQREGDRDGECTALALLGDVRYRMGDFSQSVDAYRLAVVLWQAIGDGYQEAETLIRLSESLVAVGDDTAAHSARRNADALLDRIGIPLESRKRLKLR